MTAIAVPVTFLAFANDRDDRARYLRNLAEEARQAPSCFALFVSLRNFALQTPAARRATLQAGENPCDAATLEGGRLDHEATKCRARHEARSSRRFSPRRAPS